MPRLISRHMLAREAVLLLLKLYGQEPGFVRGRAALRKRHQALHDDLAREAQTLASMIFSTPASLLAQSSESVSRSILVTDKGISIDESEGSAACAHGASRVYTIRELLGPSFEWPSRDVFRSLELGLTMRLSGVLNPQRVRQLKNADQTREQCKRVMAALHDVEHFLESQVKPYALKWKLRADWGVSAILDSEYDAIPPLRSMLESMSELRLEDMDWLAPPLDRSYDGSLDLQVPLVAATGLDRRLILQKLAKELRSHQQRLKNAGFVEYPSSLSWHARWWFEHYVKGKSYDEISEMVCQDGLGPIASYQRNVGTAVREFSRIIGIDPKTLK